jgi:hypothetical protein
MLYNCVEGLEGPSVPERVGCLVRSFSQNHEVARFLSKLVGFENVVRSSYVISCVVNPNVAMEVERISNNPNLAPFLGSDSGIDGGKIKSHKNMINKLLDEILRSN